MDINYTNKITIPLTLDLYSTIMFCNMSPSQRDLLPSNFFTKDINCVLNLIIIFSYSTTKLLRKSSYKEWLMMNFTCFSHWDTAQSPCYTCLIKSSSWRYSFKETWDYIMGRFFIIINVIYSLNFEEHYLKNQNI